VRLIVKYSSVQISVSMARARGAGPEMLFRSSGSVVPFRVVDLVGMFLVQFSSVGTLSQDPLPYTLTPDP
jgi:hypothetical protein